MFQEIEISNENIRLSELFDGTTPEVLYYLLKNFFTPTEKKQLKMVCKNFYNSLSTKENIKSILRNDVKLIFQKLIADKNSKFLNLELLYQKAQLNFADFFAANNTQVWFIGLLKTEYYNIHDKFLKRMDKFEWIGKHSRELNAFIEKEYPQLQESYQENNPGKYLDQKDKEILTETITKMLYIENGSKFMEEYNENSIEIANIQFQRNSCLFSVLYLLICTIAIMLLLILLHKMKADSHFYAISLLAFCVPLITCSGIGCICYGDAKEYLQAIEILPKYIGDIEVKIEANESNDDKDDESDKKNYKFSVTNQFWKFFKPEKESKGSTENHPLIKRNDSIENYGAFADTILQV